MLAAFSSEMLESEFTDSSMTTFEASHSCVSADMLFTPSIVPLILLISVFIFSTVSFLWTVETVFFVVVARDVHIALGDSVLPMPSGEDRKIAANIVCGDGFYTLYIMFSMGNHRQVHTAVLLRICQSSRYIHTCRSDLQ